MICRYFLTLDEVFGNCKPTDNLLTIKLKTMNEFKIDYKKLFFIAIGVIALLLLISVDSCSVLAMPLVAGIAGGKHVINEPLTVTRSKEASPDLLVNEIDRRIVKIRPMATPIDQLSRWAGAKKAGSMIVDYYSVDTRPTSSVTTEEFSGATGSSFLPLSKTGELTLKDATSFEPSETILVKDVKGYKSDGKTPDSQDLVMYILSKDGNAITCKAINGPKNPEDGEIHVPSIPSGSVIVRMGRAAAELDVQTPQFEALPVKERNYCQIFKMQIEQSTLHKIANKEVGWTFTDQEEAAIYDMRQGMEKNFLFGVKGRVFDPAKNEDILLTGGIWSQAGGEYKYSVGKLDTNGVISMMRAAFTGNAGNKRKVLIGGSGLIEQLNKLESTKMVLAGENIVKWGIDFSEISSKFGKLYVLLSEIFDECGMENNGMIIDPEYLQKYSHIPFTTEELNLKVAGVRNTDALVLTEASCMVLRYPKAHLRIIGA